ncbi:unnamed protein product [Malus baccata var. baccata]
MTRRLTLHSLPPMFIPGGPFSFDAWKKQQRKSNSSKKDSNHEALGNEWLQSGSCPITKSYGAVSSVIPLVAMVLQPPPGMKLKCRQQLCRGLHLQKTSPHNPFQQKYL